jgi:hypothetical protein
LRHQVTQTHVSRSHAIRTKYAMNSELAFHKFVTTEVSVLPTVNANRAPTATSSSGVSQGHPELISSKMQKDANLTPTVTQTTTAMSSNGASQDLQELIALKMQRDANLTPTVTQTTIAMSLNGASQDLPEDPSPSNLRKWPEMIWEIDASLIKNALKTITAMSSISAFQEPQVLISSKMQTDANLIPTVPQTITVTSSSGAFQALLVNLHSSTEEHI